MKKFIIILLTIFLLLTGCQKIEEPLKEPIDELPFSPAPNKYIEVPQEYITVEVYVYLQDNSRPSEWDSWTYEQRVNYRNNRNNQIIEKYNLEEYIENAKYTSLTSMLMFEYKYENYTDEINKKFDELNKSNEDIKEVCILKNKPYDKIVYPNIDFYTNNYNEINLNDVEIISFLLEGIEKNVFKSYKELKEELELVISKIQEGYMLESSIRVKNNLLEKYNSQFFENNILVISDLIVKSSGSIKVELKNLYLSDNILYIIIKSSYPYMGTCDMQYRMYAISIPKKYNNIKDVITLD